MPKNNKKQKTNHSIFSNIMYFMHIMFKISPVLVIGECLWGVLMMLPTRIIAVIGVKYVIDVIANGDDKRKIVYAVIAIGIVIIVSQTICWILREFVFNVEREKIDKGLSEMLYNKAKELDLESYDNPDFYNNFILVIEASSGGITQILGMIQRYVSEIISLITICSIIFTIDPV
ncbi:MAG: hypothetical protein ACLUFN_09820, partial [Eubacterium sp.]